MIWQAQPKQEQALVSDEGEILYGGARGGGKTDAGQAWLLYDHEHPRYRALVIRRNADDLKDWTDRAHKMYAPTGAKFIGSPVSIFFPNGGIIRTGHLNDEEAYTKYQGHEYQKILLEELSQIPREKDYLKLLGSCRSTVPDIKPQVFATTNPDDPGIEWIRARWKIPETPDFDMVYRSSIDIMVDGRKFTRRLIFIPAKLEDNPILMQADPDYVAYLESLKAIDPDLYEAWRKGNWKGFGTEGSYYRTQIADAEAKKRITNVPYDATLDVHTWCDLGIADSFSIGYFQLAGFQWRMIDYDEFEGESLDSAIQRMRAKGYNYGDHFAPHDIEIRELGTGMSRLELAANKGLKYRVVPKLGVQEGINAGRMTFPITWFDRTKCDLFLKRIRRYHKEFDEKRGIYKATPVHDINSHAADMWRYFSIGKGALTATRDIPTPKTASWVGKRWRRRS